MKRLVFLCVMSIVLIFQTYTAYADNATIKMAAQEKKADVGENIEMMIEIEAENVISDVSATILYDSDMLEYVSSSSKITKSAGSLKLKDDSDEGSKLRTYTIEFKTLQKGIAKIDFSGTPSVYNEDGGKMTSSYAPAYIEIEGEEDKENNLKSMKISPGVLTKKFNSSVYEYNVTVDNDIKEIVIDARAKSDKAKIEITGDTDLKVGSNKVKIKVTAESGDEKEYVIKVKRLNKDEQKEKDEKEKTEARKKRVAIYQDGEIVYMENDAKYEVLDIIETDDMKVPVDYKKVKLELYGVEMEACVLEENEDDDVILIYAKNTVNGYEGYYSYDKVEKTLQRYFGDTLAIAGDKSNKLFQKQEYEANVKRLSVIVSVTIVFLIVSLIIIIKLHSDIRNIKNDNYLI